MTHSFFFFGNSLICLPDVLKKENIFEKVRKFATTKNKIARAKARARAKIKPKKPKKQPLLAVGQLVKK